jgi:AmiR/NasT family two-component response regulator
MDVDDTLTTIAQLRAGMESRGRIGIAIGIVMATFDLGTAGAWDYLVRESQHGNVKMVHLAETVIAEQEDGHWPTRGVTSRPT